MRSCWSGAGLAAGAAAAAGASASSAARARVRMGKGMGRFSISVSRHPGEGRDLAGALGREVDTPCQGRQVRGRRGCRSSASIFVPLGAQHRLAVFPVHLGGGLVGLAGGEEFIDDRAVFLRAFDDARGGEGEAGGARGGGHRRRGIGTEIGRATVGTQVTNAKLVRILPLEKKHLKNDNSTINHL